MIGIGGTELTSISDWPDNCRDLRAIDSALRCAICFDFMKTCMIVPRCSHNYCSLCIRSYISNCKTQCPACNGGVTETDLKNNRALDGIIEHFLAIRPTLLELLKGSVLKNAAGSSETGGVSPKKSVCKSPPNVKEKKGLENFLQRNTRGQKQIVCQTHSNSDDSDGWPEFKQGRSKSGRKQRVIDSDSDFDVEVISDGSDTEEDFTEKSFTKSSSKSRSKKSKLRKTTPTAKTPSNFKSSANVKESKAVYNTPTSSKFPANVSKNAYNPELSISKIESNLFDCLDEEAKVSDNKFGHLTVPSAASVTEVGLPRTPSTPSIRQLPVCQSPSQSCQEPQASGSLEITSPVPSYGRVDCPVCGVSIPERNVNLHLDMCLAGSDKKESLRSSVPKRKPMPKLVYNLMKDADVKKKLQLAGLPTQGDRKTLIKRHHEFTIMYNAECDSDKPKSGPEIAKEITKNEQMKAKMTSSSSVQGKLNLQKNASNEDVQKAQKSYVKQHKDHFSQLIADTKKRMMEKKKEREAAKQREVAENASKEENTLSTESTKEFITSEDSRTSSPAVIFDTESVDTLVASGDSHSTSSTTDKEHLEMVTSKETMPILAGKVLEKEVPTSEVPKTLKELNSGGMRDPGMEMHSSDFSNAFKGLKTVPPPPSLPPVVQRVDPYDDSTDDESTFLPNAVCKPADFVIAGSEEDSQLEYCGSPQTPGGSTGSESPSLLNPNTQRITSEITNFNDMQSKTDMLSQETMQQTSTSNSVVQSECVQWTSSNDIAKKDNNSIVAKEETAQMSYEKAAGLYEGLIDSQRSTCSTSSGVIPLTQVAPPSPGSVGSTSSDRALMDTLLGVGSSLLPHSTASSKSSTPLGNGPDQSLDTNSELGAGVKQDPTPGCIVPTKKGKGRPKGRGQKRQLATVELPDSDFEDVKRAKLANPAEGKSEENDVLPVRRSRRQKKTIP